MRTILKPDRSGTILILALWTLGFLSILAVQLGLNVRQKVTLLQRLEQRSRLQLIAEAGVKKTIAILQDDFEGEPLDYTAQNKMTRHNNQAAFKQTKLGQGMFHVTYSNEREASGEEIVKHGVLDEESKLNLNTATLDEIKDLLIVGLGLGDEVALDLASAVVSWREMGRAELTGFYSDDYYSNLEHPYDVKDEEFEVIDELLLLKGVTDKIFQEMRKFFTVYGEGININTASSKVLQAVGFSDELVTKILLMRRGSDGIEGTGDDYVFLHTHLIAADLQGLVGLSSAETAQIDNLNFARRLVTNSYYYSIQSVGEMDYSSEKRGIVCVFNMKGDRIEYWREVY